MAFDFYFAGKGGNLDYIFLENNMNLLRSYVLEKKDIINLTEKKKDGTWKGKLLVDNGAFTVHRKGGSIDIDEYIDFINTYCDYVDYFVALDHIPGKWGQERTPEEVAESPIKTWNNYLYMIERVKNPEQLLPVFHQGENLKYLVQMLEHPTPKYICISGNKQLSNKEREAWYRLCYTEINKIKPDIKVHCLGSATMSNIHKFPFTSMDSTTWIKEPIYGNIIIDQGTIYIGDKCKHMSEAQKKVISEQIAQYGYAIDDLADAKIRQIITARTIFKQSQTVDTIHEHVEKKRLF